MTTVVIVSPLETGTALELRIEDMELSPVGNAFEPEIVETINDEVEIGPVETG